MDPTARNQAVQPSLLREVDLNKPVSRRYDLGMDDFVKSEAFEKRKSFSLKRTTVGAATKGAPTKRRCLAVIDNADRFDFTKDDSYCEMSVPLVPKNTKKNDDWASKNFGEWRECRNRAHPNDICPADLLQPPWDVKTMAYWLPRFACETRNKAGGRYPATTIISLLSGLLRRVRAVDPDAPNFMDTKNPQFREMHTIIDRYFRELRESGIGAEVKHTNVITKEEENLLWEKGVLGIDTPESLLRSVFYYNGKCLCLRGGKEHRALKISQIVRHDDPPRYIYTENGSKNRNGGFNQIRIENKVVPIFPCSEAGVRCYFSILETYISKLPPVAHEKDWFYMKPLGDNVVSKPGKPWYAAQPCGENKLATMVKSMFAKIGVSGKTNHSLRATGASFYRSTSHV